MRTEYHIPVLCNTAIDFLINPWFDKHVLVDCTTGGGGYSMEICKRLNDDFQLVCVDKDINALEFSREVLKEYSEHVIFVRGNFANIDEILHKNKKGKITGFVLDLGLSSFQLTDEDGFSFNRDTPLDMRADKNDFLTAEIVLNSYSKNDLAAVFENYGEIGNAARLAEAITRKRKLKKLSGTFDVVRIVEDEYKIRKRMLNDFLAKIFQAVRIEVNRELENLESVLMKSIDVLLPKGRIVVVSYHSLEDRMVKNFFKKESQLNFKVLTKKIIAPSWTEVKANPKARSAKLRAAEKL